MENNENLFPEEEVKESVPAQEPVDEEVPAPRVEQPTPEQYIPYSAPVQPPVQPAQPVMQRPYSPYADSPYVMDPSIQIRQPKKAKKESREKKGGFWKRAICAVLVLCVIAGSCVATGFVVSGYWEKRLSAAEDTFADKIEELEKKISSNGTGLSVSGTPNVSVEGAMTPAQVYAANVNSVVMIYNRITSNYYGQTTTGTATGSGFILNEEGYVVTNYHVVEGEGRLSVSIHDGKEYPALLVGFDDTNDVALLKIEAEGLQAAKLGSSSDLIVGDQVVAIGNPLGELTSTLTVGYISAMERDVNTDGFAINMIQTDAAINSGNSGGPLFNMKGEVIGITTAKYSGTSSSGATIEGIGFAIPIDDVSGLISDLATYGYVKSAYLGIMTSDMNVEAANYYGMPVGAYVESVEPGYAAAEAGVQAKDIIVDLGGISIENVNDLTRALRGFEPGDKTVITVYRGGREIKLDITLSAKPGQTEETTDQEG